jgi:hypothetical protein
MDIELKQIRVLILKIHIFLSIISLYIEALFPIVSQAPENQQHKIIWAAVGTRR